MADNSNTAPQAPAQQDNSEDTQAGAPSGEELLMMLQGVINAALEVAYDRGINTDVKSITFDLSSDKGDVTVSVVGQDDKTEEETIGASDIEAIWSEETEEEDPAQE